MGKGCCGGNVKRNNSVDKNGNSLKKYAFLKPNQLKIRDREESKDKEGDK
jgi:hypothetical protein